MVNDNEFNKLCNDMIKALEAGQMPPKELYPILSERFDSFPLELQVLLVDAGIVKKQRCEVWSRVMGYLRPVGGWNKGKKQEHAERNHFTLKHVKTVVEDAKEDKLKISKNGLDLVKHFEGCYLTAYKCPANKWTIGYGHTGQVDGQNISSGLIITQEKADELLKYDMAIFEKAVTESVTVNITQSQFDALVSFSFNCGAGALKKSTLLKKLNSGDYVGAANEFHRWNKANGKVLKGLVKRRAAEAYLFEMGELKL